MQFKISAIKKNAMDKWFFYALVYIPGPALYS